MICVWLLPMTCDVNSRPTLAFQQGFHQRWQHLRDPHVRALAWLLDAPDMLDPLAPQWGGRIATLGQDAGLKVAPWLNALDRLPLPLHAHLQDSHRRLGRYAEELMVFYFRHQGSLRAHGVQVQTAQGLTIGEFDFLLELDGQFTHWELATKFYLLPSVDPGLPLQPDAFIGPNLADTLGKKIGKTLSTQLELSKHSDAARVLPQPVLQAQALMKGWLFYPCEQLAPATPGLSSGHCRGYWCALSGLERYAGYRYAILPRMSWLAPANCVWAQTQTLAEVHALIQEGFQTSPTPIMVALLEESAGRWLESERVFVVPEAWHSRAIGQSRAGQ